MSRSWKIGIFSIIVVVLLIIIIPLVYFSAQDNRDDDNSSSEASLEPEARLELDQSNTGPQEKDIADPTQLEVIKGDYSQAEIKEIVGRTSFAGYDLEDPAVQEEFAIWCTADQARCAQFYGQD